MAAFQINSGRVKITGLKTKNPGFIMQCLFGANFLFISLENLISLKHHSSKMHAFIDVSSNIKPLRFLVEFLTEIMSVSTVLRITTFLNGPDIVINPK